MIKAVGITKSFNNKKIIDNVNFEIEQGKITALVGKNGCGKTTLIRLISGIYKPDSGYIDVDISKLGVLVGGEINLYRNLTGYENLKFFSMLHNMNNSEFSKRCDELSEVLDFKDFMNDMTEKYSRGMKQKIAFATAIIHNPDIILLDEPSTGLDIKTAFDVINFIDYCSHKGKTVFISTHNLFEITDLSDKVLFLNNGKISDEYLTKDYFLGHNVSEKIDIISSVLENYI